VFSGLQWRSDVHVVIVFLLNVKKVNPLTIAQIAHGSTVIVGKKIMIKHYHRRENK